MNKIHIGWFALAILVVARPILIDFQYGQVNIFILGICLWALWNRTSHTKPGFMDAFRWFLLTLAAVSKIYPLPLLLLPLIKNQAISKKRFNFERTGIALGIILIILLPAISLGFTDAMVLLKDWFIALQAKGIPTDSHNQSFVALLHHYLSGNPTTALILDYDPVYGFKLLSLQQIQVFGWLWSTFALFFILHWMLLAQGKSLLNWSGILVASLIVPSYIIWKPYFVFTLPVVLLAIRNNIADWQTGQRQIPILKLLVLFGLINLTTYDFIGAQLTAALEAASVLLFVHLYLIGSALFRSNA